MNLPAVKLSQGIHVIHLFYRIERQLWRQASYEMRKAAHEKLPALVASNSNPCQPRITCYANVGGKADIAFMIQTLTLDACAELHRQIEACFPPGVLRPIYSFFSVTELTEYMPTEEDARRRLIHQEKLDPASEAFAKRMAEEQARIQEYMHYRLYPELPDWELMGFYPMRKRREGNDNWYMLDFETRKKLMGGHARTGRKYAGRVVQMITGSTGLDDWEWGVTLIARQADDIKSIVYEMRFDEVSARYADFGAFYINLRLPPDALLSHLRLEI
jgi:chlorite dismutase